MAVSAGIYASAGLLELSRPFSWGTFAVNITGCFHWSFLGLSFKSFDANESWNSCWWLGFVAALPPSLLLHWRIGLIKEQRMALFFLYIAGSVLTGLLATFIGMKLTRWITGTIIYKTEIPMLTVHHPGMAPNTERKHQPLSMPWLKSPQGSRVKISGIKIPACSGSTGLFIHLSSPGKLWLYPANSWQDGDPLDILVLVVSPSNRFAWWKPMIGNMQMIDQGQWMIRSSRCRQRSFGKSL